MTSTKAPDVICIQDEKDQASQNAPTSHTKPLKDLPCQPINFNPKTFPFLATMLKKITTPNQKSEAQVLPTQQTIVTSAPIEVQIIKPLQIDGTQEVQEVTRIQPAQKLFEVIEDLDGLPNSSVLAQDSKIHKKQQLEISFDIKAKERTPEPTINQGNLLTVQDETQKPKENQLEAVQSCETNNIEALNPNQLTQALLIEIKQNQGMASQRTQNNEKNKNITQLIYQFSQKIAFYVDKDKEITQGNRINQEKPFQVSQHFSLSVEKASSQAQESLSGLNFALNEQPLEKPREQNQLVYGQEKRRYQVIESNILLGCQNLLSTTIAENNQQSESIHSQNVQLQFIQQSNQAQQMEIQQPIVEIQNSEVKQIPIIQVQEPVISNNAVEITCEPLRNLMHQQIVSEIIVMPSANQMVLQNKFQIEAHVSQQIEKVVQKMDESMQNLQKNNQSIQHVAPTKQNITVPQENQISTQMLTEAETSQLKKRIAQMIPDFAQKINEITSQELFEIYQMIKKELKVDLMVQASQSSYHISEGIQKQKDVDKFFPAQPKNNDHLQKQPQTLPSQNLQVIPAMTAPKMTSHEMDIEKSKDIIQEESEAITQLQRMKHLHEEQLRIQISSMNPQWRQEVSKMNYSQLQSMLDQTIAELRKSAAQKQQPQRRQQIQQILEQKSTQHVTNTTTLTLQLPVIQTKSHPTEPKTAVIGQISGTQVHAQQAQKKVQPSVGQIKQIIINKTPEMEQKVNSLSDNRIKEIYQINTTKPQGQEGQAKLKPIETIEINDSQKDKPTIEFIIKFCIEQFPQLAQDLKQLKEHQIRDIYEQLLLKIGPNIPSNTNKSGAKESSSEKKGSKAQQQSEKSGKSAEKNETNLKRNHQIMIATNAKKNEAQKPEKKKLTPFEIRNILMNKLPQLKPNIMMLDDNQIQKIFYESVQNGGKVTNNQNTPNQKPTLLIPQKKTSNNSQPKQNIQVIQTFDPIRKKKIRTVILMQNEMDIEKEGEVITKAMVSEGEIKKKCYCECCKSLNLNELLIRLGQMLQEKK